MKKLILLLIPLLLLTACGKNDDKDAMKEISSNNELKENVYQYLVDKNYLNEENLDKFEIGEITKKGQYKTNSKVVYLKMECTYSCVDGTDACILNNQATDQKAQWLYKGEDNYYFYLEYDLRKDKVLGKRGTYGPDRDFSAITG